MANEQAGTLAFLQNFYTDVTLYMPFEAHERSPETPLAEVVTPSTAASPAAPPITPQTPPLPVATPPLPAPARLPTPTPVAPAAGKLPSLAGTGLAAPVASPAPATSANSAATPNATDVPPYLLTTFSTLGSNAQGIVVLVRLPPERFSKLPRNVFLNNLLKAIGLVMADIVLVNVEGPYPVALSTLRNEIAATRILAFGKNLLDVAVRTTQIYEPVQFPNVSLAYLAGAEVEMIEYDVSLKKRLWGGLQRMFLAGV